MQAAEIVWEMIDEALGDGWHVIQENESHTRQFSPWRQYTHKDAPYTTDGYGNAIEWGVTIYYGKGRIKVQTKNNHKFLQVADPKVMEDMLNFMKAELMFHESVSNLKGKFGKTEQINADGYWDKKIINHIAKAPSRYSFYVTCSGQQSTGLNPANNGSQTCPFCSLAKTLHKP